MLTSLRSASIRLARDTTYLLMGLGLCGVASVALGPLVGAAASGTLLAALGTAVGGFAASLSPNLASSLYERFAGWLGKRTRPSGEVARNHDLDRLLAQAISSTLEEAAESFLGNDSGRRCIRTWARAAEQGVALTETDDRFSDLDSENLGQYFALQSDGGEARALTIELWKQFLNERGYSELDDDGKAALDHAADALHTRLPAFLIGYYRESLEGDRRAYVALQHLLLTELMDDVRRIAQGTKELHAKLDTALEEINSLGSKLSEEHPNETEELRVLGWTIEYFSRETYKLLQDTHADVQKLKALLHAIFKEDRKCGWPADWGSVEGDLHPQLQKYVEDERKLRAIGNKVPQSVEVKHVDEDLFAHLREGMKQMKDADSEDNARLGARILILRDKYRSLGINLSRMDHVIQEMRAHYGNLDLDGVTARPVSANELEKLKVEVGIVAQDMAVVPFEMLARVEEHGGFIHPQLRMAITEARRAHLWCPSLTEPGATDRGRSFDTYQLENVGRMVRSASSFVWFDIDRLSSGYCKLAGFVSGVPLPAGTGVLALACRAPRGGDVSEDRCAPSIHVYGLDHDGDVSEHARLVARRIDLFHLAILRESDGTLRIYAADRENVYEWSDLQVVPINRWQFGERYREAPTALLAYRAKGGKGRTLVIRTEKGRVVFITGGEKREMQTPRADGRAVLFLDPDCEQVSQILPGNPAEPPLFKVQNLDGEDRYSIQLLAVPRTPDSGTPLVTLEPAAADGESDVERSDRKRVVRIRLACAEPGPQSVHVSHSAWYVGGRPLLALVLWDQYDLHSSKIVVLVDLHSGKLAMPPLHTGMNVYRVAMRSWGKDLVLFATTQIDKTTRHCLAAWVSRDGTSPFEPAGLWHEESFGDVTDLHIMERQKVLDAIYVLRQAAGNVWQNTLYAVEWPSGKHRKLAVLPVEFVEGQSAVATVD